MLMTNKTKQTTNLRTKVYVEKKKNATTLHLQILGDFPKTMAYQVREFSLAVTVSSQNVSKMCQTAHILFTNKVQLFYHQAINKYS